jgi:hypothetical protein
MQKFNIDILDIDHDFAVAVLSLMYNIGDAGVLKNKEWKIIFEKIIKNQQIDCHVVIENFLNLRKQNKPYELGLIRRRGAEYNLLIHNYGNKKHRFCKTIKQINTSMTIKPERQRNLVRIRPIFF